MNRAYHSTTLLLPDGRVLHAGSGNATLANGHGRRPTRRTPSIYSPPYLFKGARPDDLERARAPLRYGQLVHGGHAQRPPAISKVSLIAHRLGDPRVRHDTAVHVATFTRATRAGITVKAPASRNTAPPGYYMLFILNSNGVPSKAKIIQIR